MRSEKQHAGTYGSILKQLNNLRVQHLTMAFTAAGADDLESLGRLPEDFELGLGVVDVTPRAPLQWRGLSWPNEDAPLE